MIACGQSKFFDVLEESLKDHNVEKAKEERTVDALALRGDEGRDKLR